MRKLLKEWSRGPDLNRGPVDYESTALPTELPRPWVIHSSIAWKKVSNAAMTAATRIGYWENGYISQPIPNATKRKAKKAQRAYRVRSNVVCLDKNANRGSKRFVLDWKLRGRGSSVGRAVDS